MEVVTHAFFLVTWSSLQGWNPSELWLATQCFRWLSVKGLHAECGFTLICGLNTLLLSVEEEKGMIVPYA
jgi:hypothetical protein